MHEIRAIKRVLWVTLLLNLLVVGIEGAYAWWSEALVVTTDALHSLIDSAGNIVGLLALTAAAKPPDPKHPYGHAKIEVVASLLIGVLIATAAIKVGAAALDSLLVTERPIQATKLGMVVLLGTLGINIGVAVWENRAAKKYNSPLLHADAAHTFSDVLAKLGVIAAHVASYFGVAWADPVGAIALLLVLGWVAWKIVSRNLSVLIDRVALDPEEVKDQVMTVSGVRRIHKVRSRGVSSRVNVDLHILVDGAISVRQGHDIAHDVEDVIVKRWPSVADVTVHVEPHDDEHETI